MKCVIFFSQYWDEFAKNNVTLTRFFKFDLTLVHQLANS